MIVNGDIKIYCNNVKSVMCFSLQLGNQATDRFHFLYCCTIEHRYTDFRSYLNFYKMRDVPGFCSAGYNYGDIAYHLKIKEMLSSSVSQYKMSLFPHYVA